MKRRHLLPVLSLAWLLALPSVAVSHDYTIYYTNGRWTRVGLLPVQFGLTQSVPPDSLGYDDRFVSGMNDWNQLGQSLQLSLRSTRYADFNAYVCPSDYGKNGAHFKTIDGSSGTLAETVICNVAATEMYSAQIVFDPTEIWNTGTGDIPSTHIDFWSVATHELGHATGWSGHFNESLCAAGSSQETMCTYYYTGSEYMRTPHTHDAHTFGTPY